MIDLELLKEKSPIDEVITELMGFVFTGRGAWLNPTKGTKEGGLYVNVRSGTYKWAVRDWGGDVIDFVMRERSLDFMGAVRWLADRAGIPVEMSEAERGRLTARRKREGILDLAVSWFQSQLQSQSDGDSRGLVYARGRGWTDETIADMRLGYWNGQDYDKLRGWFELHGADLLDPIAVNLIGYTGDVLKWFEKRLPAVKPDSDWVQRGRIPGILWKTELLIYPHIEMGRVQYLAGRNLKKDGEPKSWNLRSDFAGARRPMWNEFAFRQKKRIVVVEGQADLVTLSEWKIPAVALCTNKTTDDELIERLKEYKTIYVALDGDSSGAKGTFKVAEALGSGCEIVPLPADDDVNDLLKVHGYNRSAFVQLMGKSLIFPVWVVAAAAQDEGLDQGDRIQAGLEAFSKLGKVTRADNLDALVKALKPAGWNKRRLTDVLKAIAEEEKANNPTVKNKDIQTMIGGYIDGVAFETIYDPDLNSTQFACSKKRSDGSVKVWTARSLEFNQVDIFPLNPLTDEGLQDGWLKLPSGPVDFISTEELIDEIKMHVYKYVDIPDMTRDFTALYILLTWIADKLPKIPYLRAIGDYGGGKTRFVITCGAACFRSTIFSGVSSEAFIYHLIDAYKFLTLVVDEMDVGKDDHSSPLTKIFNTGNDPTFGVGRVVSAADGTMRPKVYKVASPKIVSMRQPFPDKAANSRFWDWEANQISTRDDIPDYLPLEHEEVESPQAVRFWSEARELQNKCLMWRLHRIHDKLEFDDSKVQRRLSGRNREMIGAAIAAFPEAEEMLNKLAAEKMHQMVLEASTSTEAKVVYAIIRQYHRPILQPNLKLTGPDKQKDRDIQIRHRLSMHSIAREVNRLIDIDNEILKADGDEEANRFNPNKKAFNHRSIGKIVKNMLNLTAERSTIRGSSRPNLVRWVDKQIDGLASRYGLEEQLYEIRGKQRDFYDIETDSMVTLTDADLERYK